MAAPGARSIIGRRIHIALVDILLPIRRLRLALPLQEAHRFSLDRLLKVFGRLVESRQIVTSDLAEDVRALVWTSNLDSASTLVLVEAGADQLVHTLVLELQLSYLEVHGLLDVKFSGLQAKNLEALSSQKRDEGMYVSRGHGLPVFLYFPLAPWRRYFINWRRYHLERNECGVEVDISLANVEGLDALS